MVVVRRRRVVGVSVGVGVVTGGSGVASTASRPLIVPSLVTVMELAAVRSALSFQNSETPEAGSANPSV